MPAYKIIIFNILLLSCFCFHTVKAQDSTTHEKKNWLRVFTNPTLFYDTFWPKNIKPKTIISDTNYIHEYPNKLSAGVHVFIPAIDIDLSPTDKEALDKNMASNFRTDVSTIVGVNVNYRLVSAGFAVSLRNRHQEGYAQSQYRTATIRYNGPKFYLQFKYMRVKGFTDANEANSTNPDQKYRQREDLLNKEYQFEGMYNFSWKKYSYYAPIAFSQRQLKSRIGLLLKAGVYYTEISGDSDIVSARQRPYFGQFSDISTLLGWNIKIAPGVGGNLIFLKRFYLSTALFTAYDLYFYKYLKYNSNDSRKGSSFLLVLDLKLCLGYQSERFYAGVRYEIDTKSGKLESISKNIFTNYFGIDIGYRFTTPKIVRKIYKATMPPGM